MLTWWRTHVIAPIHAVRIPLPAPARKAMGLVYVFAPVVAGYYVMEWTNAKRDANIGKDGQVSAFWSSLPLSFPLFFFLSSRSFLVPFWFRSFPLFPFLFDSFLFFFSFPFSFFFSLSLSSLSFLLFFLSFFMEIYGEEEVVVVWGGGMLLWLLLLCASKHVYSSTHRFRFRFLQLLLHGKGSTVSAVAKTHTRHQNQQLDEMLRSHRPNQ